ncbi:MAG TPA: tetratricopeptide repeat protein [Kofleriaceae bacterium]
MSQSDFVSRGQALVAAGQFQEAVKVCRLGLLGRPTTVEGRVVLGQALLALKRFDEVLAEMRVALELDHTSVAAQILRAEALLRKGDIAPAIETLHKARLAAPGDPRIMQLLGEAEHGPSGRPSVSHPAVGFIGAGDMRQQPGRAIADEPSGPEGYTMPTAMSSPGGARRSSRRRAAVPEPEPPPGVFDDKSGTVEVDPDLEGVEVAGDIDFDDLAAPPKPGRGAQIGGPRGAVIASSRRAALPGGGDGERGTAIGKKSAKSPMAVQFDLEDDDEELAATRAPNDGRARPPGPGTAVRNAVAMPSGVIGEVADPRPYSEAPSFAARGKGKPVPPPRSKPPTAQPPMSSMTVRGPGSLAPPAAPPMSSMTVRGPGSMAPPAAPLPPAPRAPIAAAMPTMNAVPPPPSPYAVPTSHPNRPTMAGAAQPPPPFQQEQLFGDQSMGAPSWGNATMMPAPIDPRSIAAANEPTIRPSELDPQILALMSGQSAEPNPAMALDPSGVGQGLKAPIKTGMRKSRSRMQLALWVLVGVVVIGGGVFAGFKIRAMRLDKQIASARQRATDLAKADTWKGWRDARDSLAGIVQASGTLANRAALARTRALIAFEFGDGIADAKADVERLEGQGGLDGQLAAAYLALAMSDAKAAKAAGDAALGVAKDDPAAHYVVGQAALLAGDAKTAATHLKAAFDKEARPLYGVGLARAHAAVYSTDEAITVLDRVFASNADHPAAVLARGNVLAASGRIVPGGGVANDVRAQLDRIVTEGKRPLAEQQHGVSPAQVAFGHLALAVVNFMRNDPKAARNDVKLAVAVNLDEQRFAEDAVEALLAMGEVAMARTAADKALKDYTGSRRARIALARVVLAQGRPADAVDIVSKQDVIALADALAVRGQAHLADGDPTAATADFEAALKKVPGHEPATIGRAWLELATGDVAAATKRVAERYKPKGSSPGLTVVYAATLRRSSDAAQRETAKKLLEQLVQTSSGFELARAQLELARIYRDLGELRSAGPAYSAAAAAGSQEARLEYGLLLIEDRNPAGGREMLDGLLRDAGDRPPAQLVIEAARARMLVGDHVNAAQLLDRADKMSGVERWKLDRERGRLALRKSDFANAAAALTRALDGCGSDGETFLLAADAGLYEPPLADKVKKLAPQRLKGRPEAKIVEGKLLIPGEKYAEAEQAYKEAKAGLKAEKASPRRVAQADFGLGLVAYIRENSGEALQMFELVMDQDPSLVDTYVFAAELAKNQRQALQFAQKAVQFNPDYPGAWLLVGKVASRLNDKKALTEAINRLTQIAPNGDELKELKSLRR